MSRFAESAAAQVSQAMRAFARLSVLKSPNRVRIVLVTGLLCLLTLLYAQFGKLPGLNSGFEGLGPHETAAIKKEYGYYPHYDSILDSTHLKESNLNQMCYDFFTSFTNEHAMLKFDDVNGQVKDKEPPLAFQDFYKGNDTGSDQYKAAVKEYQEKYQDTDAFNKYTDFVKTARLYSKCFLEPDFNRKDYKISSKFSLSSVGLESSLFPFLTGILPNYQYNFDTLNGKLPVTAEDDFVRQNSNGLHTFLATLRNSYNGRGIVIPIRNHKDLISFTKSIKIYRFLGSELPIEVVHNGAIDNDFKQSILEQFQMELSLSFITGGFDFQMYNFQGYNEELPPNNKIIFTNIKNSIKIPDNQIDENLFNVLAVLFSSFKHALVLNPNGVPTNEVLEILKNYEYSKTGSLFFKNLKFNDVITQNDLSFIMNQFPSTIDEKVFKIKNLKESVGSTRLADLLTSNASPEIFAVNKEEHFTGLLTALILSTSSIKFKSSDKLKSDFLWLGMLIAGEPISFNEFDTAVIGSKTPNDRKRFDKSVSAEICSRHKGFLNHFNRVIYFTNGVSNCDSDVNYDDLSKKKYFKGFSHDQIREWKSSPTVFSSGIIPIEQSIQGKLNDEVKVSLTNDEGLCGDQVYCAYDIVGAKASQAFHGTLFKIPDQESDVLLFLSKLYNSKYQ